MVTGSSHRIDPFRAVNATSFVAVQAVDKALVGPLAHGYEHILPVPVRAGIHHFLLNVHEPIVFVNFVLQLKPGKAAATAARFAINSTVGIGGLIDVAAHRPFKLIHRENGFANTLGFYGVKPGAYLYLPFIGPSTVRDLIGFSVDRLSTPFLLGRFVPVLRRPAVAIPIAALRTLDRRVDLEPDLAAFRKADDPYQAERKWYLERRQAEIDALHHRFRPAPEITQQSAAVPAT